MANIIPQSALVNQKTWTKVERYGRMLAQKLGYVNSISIAKYENPNQEINNNIIIPTKLYRIYYNNDVIFKKCFEYENKLDIDYKNDKLKNHEINCDRLNI
jgi:endonuclease G